MKKRGALTMDEIIGKSYDQERALYGIRDTLVRKCRFEGAADGESAMKETKGLRVEDCFFALRYPLWHTTDTLLTGCEMTETCRAAMWYDRQLRLSECIVGGIKALRECDDSMLENCRVKSPEFGWCCRGIELRNTYVEGEYPFMRSERLTMDRLELKGKYSFQYAENVTISHSQLDTKDAFWHAKRVTVTDSVIRGEYLGWYSEDLHLIRCRLIGTQPLCYCRGLVLEDCETEEMDLAFEYSEVTATVRGNIVSVKNPLRGSITADSIGEVILDEHRRDRAGETVIRQRGQA